MEKFNLIDIPFKIYCGCYFLFDNDILVYVGISNNIAVRLWQHQCKYDKHWNKVKYIEEKDYLKAIEIENYYIDKYKPKYNKAGSKLKWAMLGFKEKFDINKIPYPSGWIKKNI